MGCFEHYLAREWKRASKDSYVVFATAVWDAVGAASYLGKYLTKEMAGQIWGEWDFVQRYSSSRGWPRLPFMGLRGTVEKTWHFVHSVQGQHFSYKAPINKTPTDGAFEKVGNEIAEEWQRRRSKKAMVRMVET